METISNLINNFNGISLAVIMVLSYCAGFKNTKRKESAHRPMFSHKYKQSSSSKAVGLEGE